MDDVECATSSHAAASLGESTLEPARAAILRHCIKFSESFTRDGRLLDWCIDLRELLYRPIYGELIGRLLWERIRQLDPDFIGGMTLSAEPVTLGILHAALAEGRNVNGFSVRRKPKAYGRRRQVEGMQPARDSRVVIVDDLFDGGQTVADVISALQPFNAAVIGAAAVVDFGNPAFGSRVNHTIARSSLFTLGDLGLRAAPAPAAQPLFVFGPLNQGDYTAPHSTPFIDEAGIVAASDTGYVIALDSLGIERWRIRIREHVKGVRTALLHCDESIVFGGHDGFFYRVDRHTGALRWATCLGAFIGASPVIDMTRGVAFVAVNHGNRRSDVAAVDLAHGAMIWKTPADAESYARPALCEPDHVIVAANDGVVRCLSREDGSVRWTVTLPAQVKGWITVDGPTCFAGCFDGCLYALDAMTGKTLWRRKLANWLLVHPAAARGQVLVSSTQHVCSLSQADGSITWIAPADGRVTGVGIDPEGRSCVCASDRGSVYCMDVSSGRRRWEYHAQGAFRVTPAMSGTRCALPGYDGALYAFSLSGPAHPGSEVDADR